MMNGLLSFSHVSEEYDYANNGARECESEPIAWSGARIPKEEGGGTEENGAPALDAHPPAVGERCAGGRYVEQRGYETYGGAGCKEPFVEI